MATNTGSEQFDRLLERAYTLSGTDDAKDLYEEWASRYDKDLDLDDYASPQAAVDAVVREVPSDGDGKIKILDAGCGTGNLGPLLKKSNIGDRCVIDGLDLTKAMLDVAREKGVYNELEEADLTKPIARESGSYHAVACVGTLTKGHVGPEVLKEFARVTAKGGVVVATIHVDVFEKLGFKRTVEELETAKIVQVVSTDEFSMFKSNGERGRLVVLRKI